MRLRIALTFLPVFIVNGALAQNTPTAVGPIADAESAIAAAHIILAALDEASGMPTPEPLTAVRNGDIWTVQSPPKCANVQDMFCRPASIVDLSATNGQVLHWKHDRKPSLPPASPQ